MSEAATSKTLDQRRANHAWEAIQSVLREYPPRIVNENGAQKKVPHEKASRPVNRIPQLAGSGQGGGAGRCKLQ
jgi:hypothetical protein